MLWLGLTISSEHEGVAILSIGKWWRVSWIKSLFSPGCSEVDIDMLCRFSLLDTCHCRFLDGIAHRRILTVYTQLRIILWEEALDSYKWGLWTICRLESERVLDVFARCGTWSLTVVNGRWLLPLWWWRILFEQALIVYISLKSG
jgi:hypothetical protein